MSRATPLSTNDRVVNYMSQRGESLTSRQKRRVRHKHYRQQARLFRGRIDERLAAAL